MNEQDNEKRLLNEILPKPNADADLIHARSPRERTADHLRRILTASLALPLAASIASCAGYQVVDPVPPPAVKPNPKPGFLSIKSTPTADIEIDGQVTGLKTPQDKIELVPGIHTVRLIAGKDLEQTFKVVITSGETTSENRDLTKPPASK